MPPNPPTDAALSPAIEQHLGITFSPEEQAQILALVGPLGLARIMEIDAFANRPDFWTQTSDGYPKMKKELEVRYPTLSPAARERLATRAALELALTGFYFQHPYSLRTIMSEESL